MIQLPLAMPVTPHHLPVSCVRSNWSPGGAGSWQAYTGSYTGLAKLRKVGGGADPLSFLISRHMFIYPNSLPTEIYIYSQGGEGETY